MKRGWLEKTKHRRNSIHPSRSQLSSTIFHSWSQESYWSFMTIYHLVIKHGNEKNIPFNVNPGLTAAWLMKIVVVPEKRSQWLVKWIAPQLNRAWHHKLISPARNLHFRGTSGGLPQLPSVASKESFLFTLSYDQPPGLAGSVVVFYFFPMKSLDGQK